jgi:hypothetical protein
MCRETGPEINAASAMDAAGVAYFTVGHFTAGVLAGPVGQGLTVTGPRQ